MQGAAEQHETVPHRMVVAQAAPFVEEHADHVGKTSSGKQQQSVGGQVFGERNDGDDNHPAHGHVQADDQAVQAPAQDKAQQDPGQRQGPDRGEESPAPGAAQADQREGRIGAGNEQEDGGMVECAQDALARSCGMLW